MKRLAGLFVLVAGAGLVAGCGGSSLTGKARKVVGDPRATVISTQTVQELNGERLAIVVLKPGGSQGLGCGSFGGPYRCPHSQDGYARLDAKTHADGGDTGISKFQVAAIARARASSARFRMFPIVNQLTVRCAAPHAGASGMCATLAEPFGKPVRCVMFTAGRRPNAHSKLRTRAWIVRFRDGRVRSTVRTPHPPQPWATGDRYTCSATRD